MKYLIRVAEKHYEVEIDDINVRPVIARVDGQVFEVTPQEDSQPIIQKVERKINLPEKPSASSQRGISTCELTAPLPGTVTEVFVKAGDTIERGQVILVIEAMKMKNSIRSTRAGKIAEVLTVAGQTVAHKQTLVKFAD